MADYAPIVRALLEKTGGNQATLAVRLGVSQGTVSRWLRGGNVDSNNREAIDILAADLLGEHRRRASDRLVPIVGFAAAGADDIRFGEGQGPFGQAKACAGATEKTVAVQIKGLSLGPLFDGWIAYYDDRQDPPTQALHGRLCIVGIDDGAVLIKKMIKVSGNDKWHLLSNTQPPIFEVDVKWAAPIIAFEPPNSIIE